MKVRYIDINQGFTLIELMIAVAIIAILGAVAIPAYNGYIQTARLEECANEVAAISLAQRQFFLENNTYFPTPFGAVTTVGANYTAIEAVSGGYFRSTYREHGQPATIANPLYAAHVHCDYAITSLAIGGVPSYTLAVTAIPTASGGRLAGVAEVSQMNKTVN